MKDVLIFGAGQVAEVFAAYLKINRVKVAAFVVDDGFVNANLYGLAPIVTVSEVERRFPPKSHHFLVGMSFKGLNSIRAVKYDEMKNRGYEPVRFVHPMTSISGAKIGPGCFVMEMNVIQPEVEIGENCIIWSGNHLGHHSRIGSHVFIASHAVISGAVEIGDYSFVGVNATIRDNVKIGPRCVIGAGALILRDCAPDGVYGCEETERSRVPSHRLRAGL